MIRNDAKKQLWITIAVFVFGKSLIILNFSTKSSITKERHNP